MARAAKTKNGKTNGKHADAIELLKADHRAVEALFEKYEKAKGSAQKASIAKQIAMELSIHTTIEEEIFYPACHGHVEDDLLNEAYVEHDGAKVMVAELLAGEPDDDFYDAKVKVLSEEIKHHVKEEEQRDGLFAQAKKSGIDLADLATLLADRKEELKEQFETSGIPAPMLRALSGEPLERAEVVT